jgi:hypothetical protein
MKENTMHSKGKRMLDTLSEDDKEFLCELGSQGRIIDVVIELKKRNINASAATVCRFLRRERERHMLEEGEEMKDAVGVFASRSNNPALKKATLEAVRQRLYEQALSMGNTPDGMTKVFDTLIKEETRLEELELEARRTAVAEENLKLQRQRVQIEAFKTAVKYIPEALRILADETLEDKAAGISPVRLGLRRNPKRHTAEQEQGRHDHRADRNQLLKTEGRKLQPVCGEINPQHTLQAASRGQMPPCPARPRQDSWWRRPSRRRRKRARTATDRSEIRERIGMSTFDAAGTGKTTTSSGGQAWRWGSSMPAESRPADPE